MMSTYLIYLILIIFFGIPAAALIGCAAVEASLMKDRPQLSWLLPLGTMLASALIQRGMDGSSDLGAMLWSLLDYYRRCAFYGTAAGAVVGAVVRWFSAPKELGSPSNPI